MLENQPEILTPNNNVTKASSSRRVRPSPLPAMNMSDSSEMWESMIDTKEIYSRDTHLLAKHPNITPRMRSILLDWLSEVSELFKLHRETFYLALDFVDRYLTKKSDLPRQQLQLIGTTCLFIAAKIEEVYPPKIGEFAAVTDGACTDYEISCKELVIMETLKWSLHPITVNKWLSIFMQIYSYLEKENNRDPEALASGEKFLIPNYSATFFAQVSHLIDLCMLDIGSLQYNYDVIAASAFYHFTDEATVYSCTRFKYPDIRDCVIWMTPFALAVRETGIVEPKIPANATNQTWSNMQYHTVDLTLLERAHMKQIDLTEDSSDESAPSLPPSPVRSSPLNKKSKMPLQCKGENNANIINTNSPVTISSPIASTTNAVTSSPLALPGVSSSSSSGLGSTASSPNPLSTTSSPPPPSQLQSTSLISSSSVLTPASVCNKNPKQKTSSNTSIKEHKVTNVVKGKKRKRDVNNNNNNGGDDSDDGEDAINDLVNSTTNKNNNNNNNNNNKDAQKEATKQSIGRRTSQRRASKRIRRSYSPPTSSPASF